MMQLIGKGIWTVLKVAEESTIAEKMGILYREVNGLYYPVWDESNMDEFATLGKYAHRWMTKKTL